MIGSDLRSAPYASLNGFLDGHASVSHVPSASKSSEGDSPHEIVVSDMSAAKSGDGVASKHNCTLSVSAFDEDYEVNDGEDVRTPLSSPTPDDLYKPSPAHHKTTSANVSPGVIKTDVSSIVYKTLSDVISRPCQYPLDKIFDEAIPVHSRRSMKDIRRNADKCTMVDKMSINPRTLANYPPVRPLENVLCSPSPLPRLIPYASSSGCLIGRLNSLSFQSDDLLLGDGLFSQFNRKTTDRLPDINHAELEASRPHPTTSHDSVQMDSVGDAVLAKIASTVSDSSSDLHETRSGYPLSCTGSSSRAPSRDPIHPPSLFLHDDVNRLEVDSIVLNTLDSTVHLSPPKTVKTSSKSKYPTESRQIPPVERVKSPVKDSVQRQSSRRRKTSKKISKKSTSAKDNLCDSLSSDSVVSTKVNDDPVETTCDKSANVNSSPVALKDCTPCVKPTVSETMPTASPVLEGSVSLDDDFTLVIDKKHRRKQKQLKASAEVLDSTPPQTVQNGHLSVNVRMQRPTAHLQVTTTHPFAINRSHPCPRWYNPPMIDKHRADSHTGRFAPPVASNYRRPFSSTFASTQGSSSNGFVPASAVSSLRLSSKPNSTVTYAHQAKMDTRSVIPVSSVAATTRDKLPLGTGHSSVPARASMEPSTKLPSLSMYSEQHKRLANFLLTAWNTFRSECDNS